MIRSVRFWRRCLWSAVLPAIIGPSAVVAQPRAPADQFTLPVVAAPVEPSTAVSWFDVTQPVASPTATPVVPPPYSTAAAPDLGPVPELPPLPAPVEQPGEPPRHSSDLHSGSRSRSFQSDRHSAAKEVQFHRLETQVEQLGELWHRSRQPVADAADAAASQTQEATALTEEETPSEPVAVTPTPVDAALATEPAAGGQETVPPKSTTTPSDASPTIEPVVTGEIDRFGLADSLYAAGEAARAHDIYRQLPMDTLPLEQRQWVQFQLANCSRRQGDVAEAEQLYREIINTQPDGWLSELCRWWLLHLDDQRRLTANSARLAELLATFSREIAELTPQPP